MRLNTIPAIRFLVCLMLGAAVWLGSGAQAASPTDPTWPCVQRKVPEISPGQVWSGPPLDDIGSSWQQDAAVAELARKVVARRTEMPEAEQLIADFAETAGTERNRRLIALAAGVLSIINGERASIIAGIERYAARQKQLAYKIERQTAELQALPVNGTDAEQSERADLQEIQDWDTRIFQEREYALTYVCELPVALERRAFALGRAIQQRLAP